MSVIINKSYTLILILIFLGISNLKSQIIFTSQEEVDSYPSECMNCDIIDQDILIRGPISNFDSLSIVEKIEGSISIMQIDSFIDWTGFNNVDTITGIINGFGVVTPFIFNGFEQLKSVRSIILTELRGLSGITGFSNLENVELLLRIENCDSLRQAELFPSLKKAEFVNILHNKNLSSLKGFEKLETSNNISISFNFNLKEIEGFHLLDSVNSNLIFNVNSNLEKISGFDNLRIVGDDLSFGSNSRLKTIEGFNSLESCKSFNLISNIDLVNIPKFEKLRIVTRNFMFQSSDFLEKIDGFNALETVNGEFRLLRLRSIQEISGFRSFKGGNTLYISEISAENIEGFGSIESIDSEVYIASTGLKNIDFLSSLKSVDDSITIVNNFQLNDISGPSQIDILDLRSLLVEDNDALSICHEKWVCDYIRTGNGEVRIENNAPGCLNEDEVLQACIVDVDEVDTESLTIYPNPTSGVLNLTAEEELSIAVVYDYLGRELFRSRIENRQMDLSHLDNGSYLLHLIGENQTSPQVIKFVKH